VGIHAGDSPPGDERWVKHQDMGTALVYPTMAYTQKHTVLFGSESPASGGAGQTWELARDTWMWTQRQDMGPLARAPHALAYDSQRDRVVLFGGWSSQASQRFGDTWELEIIEPVTEPVSKDRAPE
jgi:hypothetical protein